LTYFVAVQAAFGLGQCNRVKTTVSFTKNRKPNPVKKKKEFFLLKYFSGEIFARKYYRAVKKCPFP
jgi:hypothetical protein